LDVINRTTTH